MPGQISNEYLAGKEVRAGDWTLVPFIRTWKLRLPGIGFGMTWSRPSSVWVRGVDGQELTLPIHDYTRRVIVSLFGVCVGTVLLIWVITGIGRRKRKPRQIVLVK